MTNIVVERFRDIRNYLMLVEPRFFRYCDQEESQFDAILNLLKDYEVPEYRAILNKHKILETYKTVYVNEENTSERRNYDSDTDEEYEDIPCFWVVRIDEKLYKIPGLYSSWSGIEQYWAQAHEVDDKYKKIS